MNVLKHTHIHTSKYHILILCLKNRCVFMLQLTYRKSLFRVSFNFLIRVQEREAPVLLLRI